jgi:hypothetical protein
LKKFCGKNVSNLPLLQRKNAARTGHNPGGGRRYGRLYVPSHRRKGWHTPPNYSLARIFCF